MLVPDLIAHQCARCPSAEAIAFAGASYSYADLDRASDRIAAGVRAARGDTRNMLVGVSVERSFAMVATLVGVMKAGAAYLPLDPDLPYARLCQIIQDAASELLLASTRALANRDLGDVRSTEVDRILARATRPRSIDTAPRTAVTTGDLAYVIYTSGSTGRPKGVEIEHGNVLNLVTSLAREPGFGGDDILLSVARTGFDVSVAELFVPLTTGGRIVLADEAVTSDPKRLAKMIAASRATVMDATPATWRSLLAAGWSGSEALRIWCGGEPRRGDRADGDRCMARPTPPDGRYIVLRGRLWRSANRPITAYFMRPAARKASSITLVT